MLTEFPSLEFVLLKHQKYIFNLFLFYQCAKVWLQQKMRPTEPKPRTKWLQAEENGCHEAHQVLWHHKAQISSWAAKSGFKG